MSKNIKQVYDTNPAVSFNNTDLFYLGQSPYGAGDDAACLYSTLAAQFAPTAGSASITTLGTVTTGVWNATPISLAYGGLNAALIASDGGIFYSTATAAAMLAGTATAGQILRSGSNAAPSWSTAVYPSAAGGSGNVLTSDGTNWTSAAPAASGLSQQQIMAIVSIGV